MTRILESPLACFRSSPLPTPGSGWSVLELSDLLHPVQLGTELGLLVGKQAGVIRSIWLALRIGLAKLPEGIDLLQLYGVPLLTGIGFTMSVFS